jgi:hypothetical protein
MPGFKSGPIRVNGGSATMTARPPGLDHDAASEAGVSALRSRVLLGAFLGMFLLALPPWTPWFASADLDPSWALFLGHATANGWSFGRDVVFTFGPLGYFWTSVFYPGVFWVGVAIRAGMALALAFGLTRLLRRTEIGIQLLAVLMLAIQAGFAGAGIDTLAMLLSLTAALIAVREEEIPWAVVGPLIFWSAAAGAMRFTLIVFAFACLAIADAGRWWSGRRGAPKASLALMASWIVVWLCARQSLLDLPAYFANSFQVSSSYNEGQQVWGQEADLRIFFYGVAALVALEAVLWWKFGGDRKLLTGQALLFLFLLTSSKLGFVRHDAHGLTALHGLIAAALLLGTLRRLGGTWAWARFGALAGLALTAENRCAFYLAPSKEGADLLSIAAQSYGNQARSIYELRRPLEWNLHLKQVFANSLEEIRRANPVPPLEGGVDIYPVAAGVPIAWKLDYRPRPVFQSYAANNQALVELNRRWLDESRAPRHVLYGVLPIDGRAPAMDDAPSVRRLDELYRFEEVAGDFLHLERRPAPEPWSTVETREGTAGLEEWIDLGTIGDDEALELAVDVQPNWRGKVQKALFKLSLLDLQLELGSGHLTAYRLVPGIARGGVLVSPMLTDTATAGASDAEQPRQAGAGGDRRAGNGDLRSRGALAARPLEEAAECGRGRAVGTAREARGLSGSDRHLAGAAGLLRRVSGNAHALRARLVRFRARGSC